MMIAQYWLNVCWRTCKNSARSILASWEQKSDLPAVGDDPSLSAGDVMQTDTAWSGRDDDSSTTQ